MKGNTASPWHMCALSGSLSLPTASPALFPSPGTVGILSYHIRNLGTLWPPCWRSHRERPQRDRDAWDRVPVGQVLPAQALNIWLSKSIKWPQSQVLSKCNLRTSFLTTSFEEAAFMQPCHLWHSHHAVCCWCGCPYLCNLQLRTQSWCWPAGQWEWEPGMRWQHVVRIHRHRKLGGEYWIREKSEIWFSGSNF